MQEAPSFVNVANVCFVTFIIQHYRIQGAFLLCKITNLLIYSYIRYLIRKDQDDIYSPKAAEALNGVSSSTVTIMNMVSEDSDIYSESDIFTFGAFCYHERNGRFRTGWN